ncbi:ferroxidase fet3 [Coemansia sp. RSA 1722]|nr:ferroxidase fet3 [Coemansia sp. RSA 486]KAJ2601116.1 ferroxidase fet3 [Coemansia sp. RSA 1721]KAJ2604010.1 ferroxidase fet3 [Coemansia sp. RSA 1722]KAJ2637398.1 ferroxidase fet3 [Coemansia sp. RSA 1286]
MQLKAVASVIAATTALSALAKDVKYYWDIGYVEAAPDGFSRQVIGVNGAWPPPPIYASLNDTIIVETRNSLDVPTTLHAHGLYHNGTNYMDGPYMITQCGIPPGANMTYRYEIKQTGTYWIHSHYGAQYVNGLRAPLIINDPDEPYDYDEDIVLTLDDWYRDDAEDLLKSFLSWKNPGGAEPVPNGALIGSEGGDNIHTIKFEPGKTYRIRLINMSALAMFHFSIDGHKMRVIEVDGVTTEEQEVGNIRLSAAQRTSILVTALNSTDSNFVFHADMDTDMFDSIPDGLNYNSTGIIQYADGAPLKQVDSIDWSPFQDIDLVPYDRTPAMGFDVSYTLDVYFNQFTDALNHGTFNNISFVGPKVPSMLSALTLDETDSFNPLAYGPQTNPRVLHHMNEVQLIVGNYDAGTHPFHLHGHHFQIIERGPVPYDPTYNPRPRTPPVRRDTVIIPSMEYVILRFRADNPGAWLFHCHIDWHMLGGLNMVFIEAPDKMKERIKVPQQVLDHCSAAGIATSGNAAAREGLDLTGLPEGPFLYPLGWTKKAKGAMAGCILSALVGICTILWYGWSSKDQYSRVPTDDPKSSLQASEHNQHEDNSEL